MIKFENVSKTYPNGVKGLKNINLEIEQGEFVRLTVCLILAKEN